jgi:hypothetical protein
MKMKKEIQHEIAEMYEADQRTRNLATPGKGPLNWLIYAVDNIHTFKIRHIIEKHGYPTKKMVGAKALHQFWLLIQHQTDTELQENCLFHCGFNQIDEAFLTDRICVHKGKKQIYGTQFRRNKKGKIELAPVENKKELEKRRKQAGLSTVKEYERVMEKTQEILKKREKRGF